MDLVRNLLLVVKLVGDVLVEEVCTLRKHLVAKLLRDNFTLRAFRALIDEVLKKVDDFVGQRVKAVIFMVAQLLGD